MKTGQKFKNLHSSYSTASTASTASSFDFAAGAILPNLATYIQSGIALHPNDYSEIEVEAQSSGFYVLQLRSTRYDNLTMRLNPLLGHSVLRPDVTTNKVITKPIPSKSIKDGHPNPLSIST